MVTALATNTSAPLGGLIAGTALQAATIVITMVFNVPLNIALERIGTTDPVSARQQFEGPWTRWNHVRALTATGGLAALVISALQF